MKDENVIAYANWDAKDKILFTRISGVFGDKEIKAWEQALTQASQLIPPNTHFKFLVDESGYDFEEITVHQDKRDIMPKLLASFGLELSLLSAEELIEIRENVLVNDHGIRCVAIAMNHHDKSKMKLLQLEFGKDNERYFSDYNEAYVWIRGYGL